MVTSKKRYFSLAILALGLLLLGAACSKKDANSNNGLVNDDDEIENVNAVDTNAGDDENEGENSNVNENDDVNENTNTDDDDSVNANTNSDDNEADDSNTNTSNGSNGSLKVEKPGGGDELASPFEVRGTSTASTVYVRVIGARGTTMFTVPVTVRSGEFRVNLTFEVTTTAMGSIEVYEQNASGDETNLVKVPITFKVELDDNTNSNTNANSNTNTNDD